MKKLNVKKIIKKKIDFIQKNIKTEKPVLRESIQKNEKIVLSNKTKMDQEYKTTEIKKTSAQDRAFAAGVPNFVSSSNYPFMGKYGKLLVENLEKTNFNEKYKKNNEVDYDVIIISGSYNRYEMVENQIKSFYNQKSRYSFKYIILNDGSTDSRYDNLKKMYPSIIYLKNKTSNGKKKYWKTITDLLQESKNYKAHAILQIDDDFDLCKSFLDRLMDLFFLKKEDNNKIVGISYHLYGEKHLTENRWGCDNGSWADGGCLFDYNFFKYSGFKINEIPESRWDTGSLSSGVWEQTSRSINYIGCYIYKTPVSYVNHEGLIWGSMERLDKNENNKAHTYRFIDNE